MDGDPIPYTVVAPDLYAEVKLQFGASLGNKATMAYKYITRVRYNAAGTHIDVVETFINGSPFREMLRTDVVSEIQRNTSTYQTATPKRGTDTFDSGATVYVVKINGADYLKTVNDGIAGDNLGNLPRF